jgi:hypothetical protein
VHRLVQELRLAAVTGMLVEQQHLVDVVAASRSAAGNLRAQPVKLLLDGLCLGLAG